MKALRFSGLRVCVYPVGPHPAAIEPTSVGPLDRRDGRATNERVHDDSYEHGNRRLGSEDSAMVSDR